MGHTAKKEEFAEFIHNMRTAAEFSRPDLARLLSLPLSDLESFERGENLPDKPKRFEKDLRKIVKDALRSQRKSPL